jgi:predicted nucleic acid-binding protein
LDTNILSAIWSGEHHAAVLSAQLEALKQTGTLVMAPVVYAELFAHPRMTESFMNEFLADTQINVDYHLDRSVWTEAGRRYAKYAARRRKAVSESPRRILADFMIGAHALIRADRLMTFDTNRFTHDFPELHLISTLQQ